LFADQERRFKASQEGLNQKVVHRHSYPGPPCGCCVQLGGSRGWQADVLRDCQRCVLACCLMTLSDVLTPPPSLLFYLIGGPLASLAQSSCWSMAAMQVDS
jgi:hypothetical protein